MSAAETTPRLSDLIREGLALPEVEEHHDTYFEITADGSAVACALGVAYWAFQRRRGLTLTKAERAAHKNPESFRDLVYRLIPDPHLQGQLTCPDCGRWYSDAVHAPVIALVDHLHANHNWPAQRIASWLDETVYASVAVQP